MRKILESIQARIKSELRSDHISLERGRIRVRVRRNDWSVEVSLDEEVITTYRVELRLDGEFIVPRISRANGTLVLYYRPTRKALIRRFIWISSSSVADWFEVMATHDVEVSFTAENAKVNVGYLDGRRIEIQDGKIQLKRGQVLHVDPLITLTDTISDFHCWRADETPEAAESNPSDGASSTEEFLNVYRLQDSSGIYKSSRAWLYFDASSIPQNAQITSVVLRFRAYVNWDPDHIDIYLRYVDPTSDDKDMSPPDAERVLLSCSDTYLGSNEWDVECQLDPLAFSGGSMWYIQIINTDPNWSSNVFIYSADHGGDTVPTIEVEYTSNHPPDPPDGLEVDGEVSPHLNHQPGNFSAIYHDQDDGDHATAMQVVVLDDSDAVVWDSGKTSIDNIPVNSRASLPYSGPDLSAGHYRWKCKFWDSNDSEGEWSDISEFWIFEHINSSIASTTRITASVKSSIDSSGKIYIHSKVTTESIARVMSSLILSSQASSRIQARLRSPISSKSNIHIHVSTQAVSKARVVGHIERHATSKSRLRGRIAAPLNSSFLLRISYQLGSISRVLAPSRSNIDSASAILTSGCGLGSQAIGCKLPGCLSLSKPISIGAGSRIEVSSNLSRSATSRISGTKHSLTTSRTRLSALFHSMIQSSSRICVSATTSQTSVARLAGAINSRIGSFSRIRITSLSMRPTKTRVTASLGQSSTSVSRITSELSAVASSTACIVADLGLPSRARVSGSIIKQIHGASRTRATLAFTSSSTSRIRVRSMATTPSSSRTRIRSDADLSSISRIFSEFESSVNSKFAIDISHALMSQSRIQVEELSSVVSSSNITAVPSRRSLGTEHLGFWAFGYPTGISSVSRVTTELKKAIISSSRITGSISAPLTSSSRIRSRDNIEAPSAVRILGKIQWPLPSISRIRSRIVTNLSSVSRVTTSRASAIGSTSRLWVEFESATTSRSRIRIKNEGDIRSETRITANLSYGISAASHLLGNTGATSRSRITPSISIGSVSGIHMTRDLVLGSTSSVIKPSTVVGRTRIQAAIASHIASNCLILPNQGSIIRSKLRIRTNNVESIQSRSRMMANLKSAKTSVASIQGPVSKGIIAISRVSGQTSVPSSTKIISLMKQALTSASYILVERPSRKCSSLGVVRFGTLECPLERNIRLAVVGRIRSATGEIITGLAHIIDHTGAISVHGESRLKTEAIKRLISMSRFRARVYSVVESRAVIVAGRSSSIQSSSYILYKRPYIVTWPGINIMYRVRIIST